MNKIMEAITVSTQVFPTASAAISGTVAVDMSLYRNTVAKLFAHRLPDLKGEGVITLSVYENASSTLTGTQVAASVITASITSVSDVYLEKELKVDDLTQRYIYAHVVSSTPTVVTVTVERAQPRYAPV